MSDGYCLSLAYVCLLDVVRSLSLLIDHPGQTSAQGSSSSSSSDYGGLTTGLATNSIFFCLLFVKTH